MHIVPASPEHIDLDRTVRAISAVDGERLLGTAGYYFDEDRAVIFSHLTDEVRANKRLMVKGYRILLSELKGMKVHALCDRSVEASERFLRHLGFKPLHGDIFEWAQQ